MQQAFSENSIRMVFELFWVFVVLAILLVAKWSKPAAAFRDKMLQQWKPALAIAVFCALGIGIGGMGFFSLHSIGIFCQVLIGLGLAYTIGDYEPLPVTRAVVRHEKWREQLCVMSVVAMAVVIVAMFVSAVLWSSLLRIFGETVSSSKGVSSLFPPNLWQGFFLFLAGAGIAEETTYRLVFLSLFWHLTRRPWVAITLSALLFGAYHLSPLDALYRQYWERPMTVFTMSTIMGMVMGYVYLKRGYETAILGHTLSDWIPFLLSRAV